MARAQGKLVPFILAIGVHLALGAFLFVSLDWAPKEQRVPDANIVKAVVIDESQARAEQERKRKEELERKRKLEEKRKAEAEKKRKAEQERKRKAEAEKKRKAEKERKRKAAEEKKRKAEAEKKRKAEKERKRKAEAEKKRKAEAEKKRKAEAERKRKAEAERKRKAEAERKRKAEEARQRQEAEDALLRELEEEQRTLDAAKMRRMERLTIAYRDAIAQDVQRSWRKPSGVTPDMECTVRVNQIPGGEVVDAKITSCTTTNENFKRSVINAVFKASPLPRPSDPSIFQRELEFTFKPEN